MGNNKAKSGKQAEGARCRRHRQQGVGVCACCLRDRLSHLPLSSSSLPSVVRGCGEKDDDAEGYSRYHEEEEEEASSCCSEASSTGYSSEEGSSAASSACASPGDGHDEPAFHGEMRRAARVSLLMRHERVVGDADAVVAFLRARREQRRRATTTAASFWAKLLHATRVGRGGGKKDQGCSLAARGKTLEERAAAAKWVLF